MRKRIKGIWFIGKAGVGKTTASKIIKSNNDFFTLIDGDDVRKYISTDLDYDLKDRQIQLERVYGIAQLILKNNLTPIISTVTMSEKIHSLCKLTSILVVNIDRDIMELKKVRELYHNSTNVVGLDIPESKHYDLLIKNVGPKFFKEIKNIWKEYTIEN